LDYNPIVAIEGTIDLCNHVGQASFPGLSLFNGSSSLFWGLMSSIRSRQFLGGIDGLFKNLFLELFLQGLGRYQVNRSVQNLFKTGLDPHEFK